MVRFFGKRAGLFSSALAAVFGVMLTANNGVSSTIYVATTGSASNDGSSFTKAYDFKTSLSKIAAGDTVLLQGGTYTIPYVQYKANTINISISGSAGKLISFIVANNERAVFNFSYSNNSRVLDSVGKASSKLMSYGFLVTGSYLYFKGFDITRAGYQGIYVTTGSNITFENCSFYDNWNSGLEVNKGASYVTAINCDAYRNFDGKYKSGQMADGFAFKQTQGSNNKLIGCRAWENSDDGYDTYASTEPVTFENCWAFRNGYNIWNYTDSTFCGNGNGLKVGGDGVAQNNKLSYCVSFGNRVKGFDQNKNIGSITLYNCTAYNDSINFGMGGDGTHTIKNCISLSSKGSIDVTAAKTQATNSWSSGFSVSTSDFESLDTTLATAARNADGSLPETKLFRLKSTSKLIDAGTDVGLTYTGSKPDLGAFEFSATKTIQNTKQQKSSFNFRQSINQNTLRITLGSVVQNAKVAVYSLNGEKVASATITNGKEITIDCTSLTSGFYLTEVDLDGVKQQLKFTL